jgi:hypothetical protein
MNNNIDINQLMQLIGQMDKKDLENAISKANDIINSKEGSKMIENLKNNMK